MENAVDALKIAAAILIFIIAIASSFSLFGTAKQTADSIITMRDKQAYLTSAELDNGILYTSSSAIQGEDENIEITEKSSIGGLTKNGDRIVKIDDIISTIQRYSKEKYGVTIVEKNGTVIARFDSNTENIMRQWNNIESGLEDEGDNKGYITKLINNTTTDYVTPKFSKDILEGLYEIDVTGNSKIKCGAPWYGNDEQIQRRINYDINGGTYEYNGQTYEGKNLIETYKLDEKTIVEVTNEIDQSTYLKQTDENGNPILDENGNSLDSDLLQQYDMPTIEIVYIILD